MKKKLFFAADTKLQIDQIDRRTVAIFIKPLFIQKSNLFNNQTDHYLSRKETRYNNLDLVRKTIETINKVIWFELFTSLNNKKRIDFFLKKTNWLQSDLFWNIAVQGWTNTSNAIAVSQLRTLNCFKGLRFR